MSDQAADNAPGDGATSQWAEGLGRVFRHVAIFEVQGTVARVSAVCGVPTAVRGRSLSLSAQTPLRWSLEAASALVNSGSSPGGAIIAKGLGLLKPRAFGVLPLMVEGDLVAIAYVDNGEESLSMSSVSKVFGAVDASLRDDVHYAQSLEGEPQKTDSTGEVEPESPLSEESLPEPVESLPSSNFADPGGLPASGESGGLGELDELEAMLDAALAESPLSEESESAGLEEEEEEERFAAPEPGPPEKKVVPLQEHIRARDEPPRSSPAYSFEPPAPVRGPPPAPTALLPSAAKRGSGGGASSASQPPPPALPGVSGSAPPPAKSSAGLEASFEPEFPALSGVAEVPVVDGDTVDVPFDDDDDVWAESQLEEFFGSMEEPGLAAGFEAARSENGASSREGGRLSALGGPSSFSSPEKKSVADKRAERKEKLNEVIGVSLEEEEDFLVEDELIETPSRGVVEEFPRDAAPPPPLIGIEPSAYPALDALKELRSSRVKPPRSRLTLMVAGFLGALLFGGLYLVAPPSVGAPGAFSFRVYANSSVNQIATHLERQGVVRSGPVFMLLARFSGAERGLRAGQYSISRRAWVWDVVEELRRGQVRTRTVTVPEGLTLQETAEIMEASGLVSTEAFMEAAGDSELITAFNIKAPSLEGFLFPETYTFAEDLSARDVVREMVELFFERIGGLVRSETSSYDLMEYVTLASIIEREAKGPLEMKRIAGVFTNRLTRNMRLESCATVQYILGKPKERLMLSDLRKESPYNTYLKPGLPPGPISNPGLSALRAAFAPENHDFLFFLVKNDGSNEHVFTQTYAQHQQARLAQKQVGP